ncbi:MAG: beta-galactosidase, partial [Planctomycetota bacterium]
QWERDLDHIAESGLQIVHYAEFAWRTMEPAEGRFEFGWLDDAVEMATERGLDVILCTPTAVVPQWLLQKRPEILLTRADGSRKRVGGRRHYSPTSPAMLDASARITTAMAEHFGDRAGVVGWQIDNELSSNMFDQSDATHAAFRAWLREKYGDLDTLNAAWGNQFWQTQYNDWDQLMMPISRDPGYDNPHHCLDASRFWSHAWRKFVKVQSDILRKHVGERWLTTNFMPFHPDIDPADLADLIDVSGIDVYPINAMNDSYRDEDELRYADETFLSATYNSMAAPTGRWALLEVQPGQLNWSGVPTRPKPDAVKRMLWQAIDKGCEFITVYRWRNPPWGQEMHHGCLLRHDGVTPTDAGRAFFEVAAALKAEHAANNATYRPLVREPAKPMCGLAHEMDQVWWCTTLPQAKSWRHVGLLADWTGAAEANGYATRQVCCDGSDWDGLPVVVLPAVQMIEEAWIDAWRKYVEAGGHLVVTCRTAWQNKHGHMWERPGIAEPIHDLIGGKIVEYDGLPKSMRATVRAFDESFEWHVWAEQVEPHDGTEVLGTFADQFYAGTACITTRKLGAGQVTFVGVIAERLPAAVMSHTSNLR